MTGSCNFVGNFRICLAVPARERRVDFEICFSLKSAVEWNEWYAAQSFAIYSLFIADICFNVVITIIYLFTVFFWHIFWFVFRRFQSSDDLLMPLMILKGSCCRVSCAYLQRAFKSFNKCITLHN